MHFKNLISAAHWYICEQGNLFLVTTESIDGDTPSIVKQLASKYKDAHFSKVDTHQVATELNLAFVPSQHRYFDAIRGNYCE